jgi:hypothetical protein
LTHVPRVDYLCTKECTFAKDESSVMSKMDDIEKKLDGRITHVIVGSWAVVLLLLGWMGVGTGYLMTMRGDIQAIKQYEKDHGGEIVKNIESPATKEQLAANLSLVSAQIQVARSENHKPDRKNLAGLQGALQIASREHPDIPEVWQADAQLVSYKSTGYGTRQRDLPPCD